MKKFLTLLGISIFLNSCTKDLGGGEPPINVPSSTTLTGSINSTITLTSDKVWTLKGYVYVTDGAKLIIQPGTTIVSDLTEKGALCIERGAQIIAEGTPSKPIVFTSGKPEGQRNPGDWGGVVILGRSTTNRSSEPTIEGGIGRPYGGTNESDNSGVLKYVRIEYAGIAALPNSEINALTLGGVGSGTVLENIQTIYANDDAFEFFGGTVNAKNLYAFATADDDFDFDFGYRGSISYSVAKRDPQFVDNGDAGNGVECDNDGTGSSAQPYTHPKLSYMVIVGPNNSLSLSNHNLGLRWRRATQFTIINSIIAGHMKGSFSLESNETATFYKDGISKFENNQIGSFDPLLNFKSTSTLFTASEMKTKSLSQGNIEKTFSNSELQVLTSPSWTQGWTRFPLKGN
jgi:hypothetical protein